MSSTQTDGLTFQKSPGRLDVVQRQTSLMKVPLLILKRDGFWGVVWGGFVWWISGWRLLSFSRAAGELVSTCST